MKICISILWIIIHFSLKSSVIKKDFKKWVCSKQKDSCWSVFSFLCTGAFLDVGYSFLLISNKFCDLRKIYCTGSWKLARIPFHNPLMSPSGALVHKTTFVPLIVTALYVMLLMWANPLLGQVEGGWTLEISTFLAPNDTCLTARCHLTVSISGAQPPPDWPCNVFACIKSITYRAV